MVVLLHHAFWKTQTQKLSQAMLVQLRNVLNKSGFSFCSWGMLFVVTKCHQAQSIITFIGRDELYAFQLEEMKAVCSS